MLDWPGRIAATVFIGRCNFRCPFCHNAEIVVNEQKYENLNPDELIAYLVSRRNWVDAVVITGGEPTIAPALPSFLGALKQSGFNVKLDTNGTKPRVLEQLFEDNLVDFVAMDIKTSFDRYPEAVRVPVDTDSLRKSVRLIVNSGIEHEFRTTVVPGIINEHTAAAVAAELSEAGATRLVLQQFQNKNTLDPEFELKKPYSKERMESIAAAAAQHLEVIVRGI